MKFALSLPVLRWERNSTLIACHSHSHCFILIVILIACHDWVIDSVLASLFVLIFLLHYEIVCRCTIDFIIKEKEDLTAQPSVCHKIPIQIKTEGGKISLQSVTSPG